MSWVGTTCGCMYDYMGWESSRVLLLLSCFFSSSPSIFSFLFFLLSPPMDLLLFSLLPPSLLSFSLFFASFFSFFVVFTDQAAEQFLVADCVLDQVIFLWWQEGFLSSFSWVSSGQVASCVLMRSPSEPSFWGLLWAYGGSVQVFFLYISGCVSA